MTALSGCVTTLLKPQVQMTEALRQSKIEMAQFTPATQKLLSGYLNGSISQKAYTKDVKALDPAMQQQIKTFLSQNTALGKAKAAIDAQGIATVDASGKFVGWSKIIDELQPKFKHMTELQQIAYATTLFGAGAAKQLTKVIDSGSESYKRATDAVAKQGSAQKAAAIQNQTFSNQLRLLKSTVDDLFIQFGSILIPILVKVGKAFAAVTLYVVHHKALLYSLGILIGGFLATVIGVFVVNKMVAFGKSFVSAGEAVIGLVKKLPFFSDAVVAAGDETVTSAEEQATAMDDSATSIETSTQTISTAVGDLAGVLDGLATSGPAAFEGLGSAASTAATQVESAMARLDAAVEGSVASVEGSNAAIEESFAGVGVAAQAGAEEVSVALAEERGVMVETAATAETTAATTDAALATEGGGAGLGLAGGAAGGALGKAGIVVGAGIAAYAGTTYLLHHTAAGNVVNDILGIHPNGYSSAAAIPVGAGTATITKSTAALVKEHGGLKGFEKWAAEITAKSDNEYARKQRADAIEQQQLGTISQTLIGQDVLPKDVRLLDRAGLGKDIGTEAGSKIAELLASYLQDIQSKHLRVNEGDVRQIVGELHIHDAHLTARQIIDELSWAVHSGKLGALK